MTGKFRLDDIEAALLLEACATLDVIDALAADLSVAAAREARQQRITFSRLLDKLGLPYDEDRKMTPAQQRAQKAARSRWGDRS